MTRKQEIQRIYKSMDLTAAEVATLLAPSKSSVHNSPWSDLVCFELAPSQGKASLKYSDERS